MAIILMLSLIKPGFSLDRSSDLVLDRMEWQLEKDFEDSWSSPVLPGHEDPFLLQSQSLDIWIMDWIRGNKDNSSTPQQQNLEEILRSNLPQTVVVPQPSSASMVNPHSPALLYQSQNKDMIFHAGWFIQVDACYFRMKTMPK